MTNRCVAKETRNSVAFGVREVEAFRGWCRESGILGVPENLSVPGGPDATELREIFATDRSRNRGVAFWFCPGTARKLAQIDDVATGLQMTAPLTLPLPT